MEKRISKDSINLCEMPLSCFNTSFQETIDMFGDGVIPVIATDPSTKKAINGYIRIYKLVKDKETVSAFTKNEEDVLVALLELSHASKFQNRTVEFKSLRQLIKLLGWPTSEVYYQRLFECLKNLKLTTIETDIFWDNNKKQYGDAIFNIIDEIVIFERNAKDNIENKTGGYFSWGNIVFESIKQGMIKSIDINQYQKIKSAAARKLFRVLDKRFYNHNTIWFPLEYLAVNILRLKKNGNWYYKRNIDKYVKQLLEIGYLSNCSYFIKHNVEYICLTSSKKIRESGIIEIPTNSLVLFETMLKIGVNELTARRILKTKSHKLISEWLYTIENKLTNFTIDDEAAFFVEALNSNYNVPETLKPSITLQSTTQQIIPQQIPIFEEPFKSNLSNEQILQTLQSSSDNSINIIKDLIYKNYDISIEDISEAIIADIRSTRPFLLAMIESIQQNK